MCHVSVKHSAVQYLIAHFQIILFDIIILTNTYTDVEIPVVAQTQFVFAVIRETRQRAQNEYLCQFIENYIHLGKLNGVKMMYLIP